MTLSEYIKKKNGVPIGHPDALRNNLYRSLGARNFPAFWNFWNPIFSYYLGKKIFKPAKKFVPAGVAVIITFVVCGLIHDAITTLIRGKVSLFFSVWFLIMGIVVVLSKQTRYDLLSKKWGVRAGANLLIIITCLLLTVYLNQIFRFY